MDPDYAAVKGGLWSVAQYGRAAKRLNCRSLVRVQALRFRVVIRRLWPGKYPLWTGPEMEGSIPSRGTWVHVETATHISLRHAALYAIGERHHL